MNRIKHLFRNRQEQQEKGNTLVMFVMLFPIIFSIFGLAIDTAIGNYIKDSVNDSMSTAVKITLSQASNPVNSDRPMLTEAQAYDIVKRMYAKNTGRGVYEGTAGTTVPFLMCQNEPLKGGVLATAPAVSPCAWTEPRNGFKFSNANRILSVEYAAVESSQTAFLQFVNIPRLTYQVSAKANTSFSGAEG